MCAKAEEGIGAGAGKDAEVLGRGEKINAGKIGAVEQEVHMAAAGRGPRGRRGMGHGEAPKLGDERAKRKCIRVFDIPGMATTQECRGEGAASVATAPAPAAAGLPVLGSSAANAPASASAGPVQGS